MENKKPVFNFRELLVFLIAPLLIGLLILVAFLLTRASFEFSIGSLKITGNLLGSLVALIAVFFGGWQRFYTGITDVLNKKITVNVFVTTAIFISLLSGEFLPSAIIILIMSVVGSLEAYTLDRTRKSISSLLDLTPKKANIKVNGEEKTVNISEIKLGDIVVVRPGERIPVDGIVTEGYSSVNQAPITGEPIPVDKISGDEVFAGTLNETGRLEIKTTKVGEDTTIAKIVHLVESAQESKAPIQNIADKFTTFFLPTVLGIAIIAFIFTGNLKVAVAVLLVACPCAFAIATPSAVSAGIANMARKAVLIKGGIYFEIAGKMDTLVIDKTGTVTLGKPIVSEIISFDMGKEELLKICASAEKYSEHPLAKAITNYAREKNIITEDPEDFKITPGMGVSAKVDGKKVLVGKENFIKDSGIEIPENVKNAYLKKVDEGKTVVFVAVDNNISGIISIEDEIKPETVSAIDALKNLGLKNIIMLTGDNENTAREVSRRININKYYAELMPEEKQNIVKDLKKNGKVIGMVGDGINDAPALALADVGIVMGKVGTDIAIEASNVTLMDDNINKIVEFIKMSRKVLKRIKLNIFFSIIYNVIGLTLASFGLLTPVMAVVFQEAGCITVVLSSTLLLFERIDR